MDIASYFTPFPKCAKCINPVRKKLRGQGFTKLCQTCMSALQEDMKGSTYATAKMKIDIQKLYEKIDALEIRLAAGNA